MTKVVPTTTATTITTSKRSSQDINPISRSIALERAYVHDVYSVIARECNTCSPVRSHVKEFLFEQFEMGSILLDVGCGDGKYLNLKSDIVTIGLEKCLDWFNNDYLKFKTNIAGELLQLIAGDVIHLPFRSEFFDGVLCCGVLHHICTSERRIRAIKEMTRIIKIGGKILLTVTSGPFIGRELQSQDVLLKWESRRTPRSDTDDDTSSCSNSSSSSSDYPNIMYESCNSPNSDSNFASCYSFMRKALQRLSFTGGVPVRSFSVFSRLRTPGGSSISTLDNFPIELRNIEEEEGSSLHAIDSSKHSSESLSNKKEEKIEQIEKSDGVSLFSIIRQHLVSFNWQFKKKPKPEIPEDITIINQSNAQNGFLGRKLSHIISNLHGGEKSILLEDLKLKPSVEEHKKKKNTNIVIATLYKRKFASGNTCKPKPFLKSLSQHQKSFSSDSLESRHTSTDTNYSLVAYYSMPELSSINESNMTSNAPDSSRYLKNKPKLTELHPITFLRKKETCEKKDENLAVEETGDEDETLKAVSSEDERYISDEREYKEHESNQNEETSMLIENEMRDKCENEMEEGRVNTNYCNKFPKKLLRQRSFSADYQPEVPKPQSESRRYSASPNIGAGARMTHITHQMSIDSEESLITIIPAGKKTRDSLADTLAIEDDLLDDDFDEEENSLGSVSDDDACCEELNELFSDDNTSASTVTTKSQDKLEKSQIEVTSNTSPSPPPPPTPSPPKTLHRYFHIFREGELEQLIEHNIRDLHVVSSYYNEHATSWCLICEKVQVWTI